MSFLNNGYKGFASFASSAINKNGTTGGDLASSAISNNIEGLKAKFSLVPSVYRKAVILALEQGVWGEIMNRYSDITVGNIEKVRFVYVGRGLNWEPEDNREVFNWLKERYPRDKEKCEKIFTDGEKSQLWVIYKNTPREFILKFELKGFRNASRRLRM